MRVGKFRLAVSAGIAILPSFLKRPLYRGLFGYRVGKGVRIGFSIIAVRNCDIADGTTIGHLNLFLGTERLTIGERVRIGYLNIIRGGSDVSIGRYCEILRMNEINSIPDPIVVNTVDQTFILGEGSVIAASHKIDFTDRVELGKRVIVGGRNSSFWTHNRQMTEPIIVGDYSYLGSEIRMTPGSEIPAKCIVGIGAVVTKKFEGEYKLIAGVPAKIAKDLDEDGRFLTEYKTRADLPDDI
jgi:acetyltransferase-like isoleucine patch superfamily enzyme